MRSRGNITRILKGESAVPLYFFALWPVSALYGTLMRLRAWLYRAGVFRVRRLPCKVVSVGNLVAGGTGKTPMTIFLARRIAASGLRPAVLMRGYGGRTWGRPTVVSDGAGKVVPPGLSGDEAALIAASLPDVPVVTGRKRHEAGMLAVKRFRPDVVILDDAFQHMAVHRDLDILLLDARRPLGNGFVLPMGYLREPVSAASRADLAVLTRSGAGDAVVTGQIRGALGAAPLVRAKHRPTSLRALWQAGPIPLESLGEKRVLAVSGIAEPASFALILQKLNAKISGVLEYPDHHAYKQADLAEIESAAASSGAEAVVTTEKDAVKLEVLGPAGGGVDFLVLGIELGLIEGESELDRLLNERIAGGAGAETG